MAQYGKAVLTDAGAALLAKAQAGQCVIKFTCMATGNGTYTDEEKTAEALETATALKSQRQSFAISSLKIYNETAVMLTASITNHNDEQTLEEGYYIQEIGIFAQEDGVDGTEVLYSITLAEISDYLPPYNGYSPAIIIQRYSLAVGNEVELTIEEPSFSEQVLLDHVGNEENPHNLTKKQIGLNNVENTADEDKIVKQAAVITDNGDASKSISIAYKGASVVAEELTHLAGYTDNGSKIRAVTKAVLQTFLGLGDYVKKSDYIHTVIAGLSYSKKAQFTNTNVCVYTDITSLEQIVSVTVLIDDSGAVATPNVTLLEDDGGVAFSANILNNATSPTYGSCSLSVVYTKK